MKNLNPIKPIYGVESFLSPIFHPRIRGISALRPQHSSLITILFILTTFSISAQENTVTAGGNATGSGGSVSFSVGQVFYQTHEGSGGSVAEGLQQPYEIYVVTSVDDMMDITLSMKAFPNPVVDRLQLVVDEQVDFSLAGYHFRLLDSQGRTLQSDRIINRHTEIDMSQLPPAVYFLRVMDSRRELKTFKVIKR
ncbi:MAG: T9SS C-terminal target domain-containing protein [Bacteroidetes bacterium]|nr:MAG: T9SS C-terminal target domain-containing protein [Bacteroidota bacterium]